MEQGRAGEPSQSPVKAGTGSDAQAQLSRPSSAEMPEFGTATVQDTMSQPQVNPGKHQLSDIYRTFERLLCRSFEADCYKTDYFFAWE